jgi:hypothetical protein
MLRLDDPPAFDDIPSILGGAFEHSPKIDLGEASVDHSLEEMRAELQLPVPPLRPCATTQGRSPSLLRVLLLVLVLLANASFSGGAEQREAPSTGS